MTQKIIERAKNYLQTFSRFMEDATLANIYKMENRWLKKEIYDLNNHIAGLEALVTDYEQKQSSLTVSIYALEDGE